MTEIVMENKQVSLIKAVLDGRCPACRQGKLFTGPWNRLNFLEINFSCPVCAANLIPEPGFYTGAMYVSYAFNIVQLVIVGMFTWLVFNPESPWVIIAAVLGVTVLCIPFTSRLSRVIWLYMFGGLRYGKRS